MQRYGIFWPHPDHFLCMHLFLANPFPACFYIFAQYHDVTDATKWYETVHTNQYSYFAMYLTYAYKIN
jgi:hypothetical protein